ncbi:MAG TPA: S8 family serine peptidase [Solirubrobacteraceae bacterium]|nr:S8 family serine peptidase [Solirubrobacteraceae bacterium]
MERFLKTTLAAALGCLACAPAAGAAGLEYDPNTVIVKYADGASSSQRSLAGRLAGVLERLGSVADAGADVLRVTGDPAAVAARLNRSPAVLYAEPNYILRASAPQIPNDPRFGELYGLNNVGQSGGSADADIDAPEGWDVPGLSGFPTADAGAKVGIVDTGIMAGHEDLAGKVVDCAGVRSFGIVLGLFANYAIDPGKCVDNNGHGTHVAGTIAARANNGRGIAGVAFNSPLAICKALDANGSGATAGIANCITYLSQVGAKVISMSFGGSPSTTLANAVANASTRSVLVAASGNTGDAKLSYPAGYPQVVSVAATDRRDARASFSTANSDVEITAPGVDILSTWSDGGYRAISGTSMSTPHVAGVAAIIAGRAPSAGPTAWRTKLDGAVDHLGSPGRNADFGFGRVNLAKAVAP